VRWHTLRKRLGMAQQQVQHRAGLVELLEHQIRFQP